MVSSGMRGLCRPAGRIQPLLDLNRGVVAALPMQHRVDDRAVAADDDPRQRRARDALAGGRCGRVRPGALEIGAERHQLSALRLAERRRPARHYGDDFALDPSHGLQRFVPTPLQLAGGEPIGGIDGIVLPAGMHCLIARLLQR